MSDIYNKNFVISRANTAKSKQWNRQELNFEQFCDAFSNHREDTRKDGPAFVPGEIMGGERKATAVSTLYCIVFDIDSGQTYEEVRNTLNKFAYEAIMFTTYSHMKTVSHIKTDNFARWAAKHNLEPSAGKPLHTQENIDRYVDEELGEEGRAKLGGKFVVRERLAHTPDGMQIAVDHPPIEKFRVVIPFEQPFIFSSHGYTSAEQVQMWKRWYHGIGKHLGLRFDKSCADPPRLYYFPSHPPGDENFRLDHLLSDPENPDAIKRKMLDFHKIQQVEVEALSRARPHTFGTVNSSGEAVSRQRHVITFNNGSPIDLDDFFVKSGAGSGPFFLAYLQQTQEQIFRGGESPEKNAEGLWHIECPFEEFHTNPGGQGTFLHTNNGEGFPRFHCMHNSCQGHRNEDFVARMVEIGWLDARAFAIITGGVSRMRAAPHAFTSADDWVAGRLSDGQIKKTNDGEEAKTPIDERTRDEVLATLEKMRTKLGDVPPKLTEYLGTLDTLGQYEQFWQKHAPNYNYKRDAASDIFLLALTEITFPIIRLYYKENVERFPLRLSDVEQAIAQIRQTLLPLEQQLDVIIQKRFRNTDLDKAVADAALYFNMTATAVKAQYDIKFAGYANEIETEIREAATVLNKRYAKLVEPEDTRYIDLDTWRETGRCTPIRQAALEKLYSNHRYLLDYGDTKPKEVPLLKYWLERMPDHQVYHGKVFDPSFTSSPKKFNTFCGFNQVKPIPGDWGLIADHLKMVWCNGSLELFNWLITMMANIVQQPGQKYPTGVAIIGKQGTGKSIVLEHGFLPIVAPYGRISSKRDDLTNKFNSVFAECLVYVGEESVFAGDPGAMQKIKAYLSGSHAEIEMKGKESSSEKLFTRFFFTSNDEHALRLEPGDRRFLVLEASNAHTRDIPYFEKMRTWFDTVGRQHLFDALLTWSPESVGMSWGDLNDAPVTNVKLRQIKMSHDPPKRFFLDLLIYGTVVGLPEDRLEQGNIDWALDSETVVSVRKLSAAMRDYIAANGNRTYDKDRIQGAFEAVIGQSWFKAMARKVSGPAGTNVVCVTLPPRRTILDMQRGKLVDDEEYNIAIGLGAKPDEQHADHQPDTSAAEITDH